jgi:hypothetical protein
MSRCEHCGHGDPNMAVLDREKLGITKRNPEDVSFQLCSSCVERLVIAVQESLRLCEALESGVADQVLDALREVRKELQCVMVPPDWRRTSELFNTVSDVVMYWEGRSDA